jgi:hypothetical protein
MDVKETPFVLIARVKVKPGKVENGFNLVPRAKTTSAFEISCIAAFDPLYPKGPTANG